MESGKRAKMVGGKKMVGKKSVNLCFFYYLCTLHVMQMVNGIRYIYYIRLFCHWCDTFSTDGTYWHIVHSAHIE